MIHRVEKNRKRQNHEKLLIGKSLALHTECRYFLLPSSWLAKWRAYVTTTGKNVSSMVEPENLEVIISSLICEKVSATQLYRIGFEMSLVFLSTIWFSPNMILQLIGYDRFLS